MPNYNLLKYAAPLGIWIASSCFNGYRNSLIVESFYNATADQINYLEELKANPAGNETYWNNKLFELNDAANLFDSKMGMDFVSTIAIANTQIALQMISKPIAFLPLIPYTIATSTIAYAESTRTSQYRKVIEDLWSPDCSTKAFKDTLRTASDAGKEMSAKQYADFITKLYQVEDTTKLVQLATLGAGLYNAYKDAIIPMDDAPPTPPTYPKRVDTTMAYKPASLSPASASGNPDPSTTTPAGYARAPMPMAPLPPPVIPAADNSLFANVLNALASRDVKLVASSVATFFVVQNVKSIGSNIYSAVSSAADWLVDSLASNRSIAVGKYVLAREEVRKAIEIDILTHQYEICAAKNSDINAKWLDTYTTDACYENDITETCHEKDVFENLLIGKENCKVIDPAFGG